jgi:hypothetical protein
VRVFRLYGRRPQEKAVPLGNGSSLDSLRSPPNRSFHSFRGIPGQRAIGLGAIAGGVTEVYLTFGLILTFTFLGGAIVLLGRSFSGGHPMRATLSVLSMCWSVLIFSVLGLLAWLFLVQFPRAESLARNEAGSRGVLSVFLRRR